MAVEPSPAGYGTSPTVVGSEATLTSAHSIAADAAWQMCVWRVRVRGA
eukprot:SAG31_NODE_29348_length_396_cov_1.380471_2_plen_47_part_01